MHSRIVRRAGKTVTLEDQRKVVEFINCSYLGLDQHPVVVAAGKAILDEWGINYCCARTRQSIAPHYQLEEELGRLLGGKVVTFPSVSSTHCSVLPLVASGLLLNERRFDRVRLIFDRFAHASMQYLLPVARKSARTETIPHNDLNALRKQISDAHHSGEEAVYVADGVYSMGGLCPVRDVLDIAEQTGCHLYLDDAHGTSVYGQRGEGLVLDQISGTLPAKLMIQFSLAKGFGCHGGGVLLPTANQERLVRQFGQTYMYSGPLSFSIIGAALACLELHRNGTVAELQRQLIRNIETFRGNPCTSLQDRSPIRMIPVGESLDTIRIGAELINRGFFVSTTFFPTVPLGHSQLRVCISAAHSREEVETLRREIDCLASGCFDRDCNFGFGDC